MLSVVTKNFLSIINLKAFRAIRLLMHYVLHFLKQAAPLHPDLAPYIRILGQTKTTIPSHLIHFFVGLSL
jgi:predicted nucleotidyltransferase